MPKLINKLDQFQSHNVHFVVLAARTTEDVRRFTENSDTAEGESLQAIDTCSFLGDEVKLGNSSGVFLMMDTRRFSQFTIDNFMLESTMAGFAVPGSNSPNATSQNMSFTVLDNIGISFANFLQYLMDQKLGVSFDGMVLLVKILFVGHNPDGETSTISSMAIPAIFHSITMDLNSTRGEYNCSLIPLTNMASNAGYNSKWTSIGTASSFFSGNADNTLGALVNSFERNLNELAVAEYTRQNKTGGGKFGRPVQYMITIPKDWEKFVFSGPSNGSSRDINFKQLLQEEETRRKKDADKNNTQSAAPQNAAAPAKDSYVAVDPNLTVTEVLDVLFSQCVEIAKLGNFTRKIDTESGNIKFYKHLVSVTSDDSSFTVHIDVVEYVVPNIDAATQRSASGSAQVAEIDAQLYVDVPGNEDHGPQKVPRNFIEFDYIFSGKNLDMLSLDIKIENLNFMLMSGVKLGQSELTSVADTAGPALDGDNNSPNTYLGALRSKDPVMLPQRTYLENSNFSNLSGNISQKAGDDSPQAVNQQYIRNLSSYYNGGTLNAKATIRGNPAIFERITLQHIPNHVSAVTITDDSGNSSVPNPAVKSAYRTEFEREVLKISADKIGQPVSPDSVLTGPAYVASPVFVKINIFGPNVDFSTNQAIEGDYTQKLFYDNYYFLDKIVSKVEGAKFTQELELRSFSVYGHKASTATTMTDKPKELKGGL